MNVDGLTLQDFAFGLGELIGQSKGPTLRRGLVGFAGDLFTLADIDRLLCIEGLRPPFVALSNARTGLTPWNYAGHMDRFSGGYSSQSVLQQLIRQRTTLILQHVHRRSAPLHAFALALERQLAPASVQCNAYLTPAEGRGVPPHADQHHTILIQLSGRKHWRVWSAIDDSDASGPIRAEPGAAARMSQTEEPQVDAWLEAGDWLMIPRGHVHSAVTGERHSLHLTFGIVAPQGSVAAQLAIRGQLEEMGTLLGRESPVDLASLRKPWRPTASYVEIV